MIEASYTEEIGAPVDVVWRFVEVIPNWAPFLVGFQDLELVDDRRSIWTLRGDVGVLARQVQLQADITVWEPGRRAEFTVTGLTERITGRGTFQLEPAGDGDPAVPPGSVPPGAGPSRPGRLRRWRLALAGALLRWLHKRSQRSQRNWRGRPGSPAAPPAGSGVRPAGGGQSRISMSLQLTPGGPMAPMVELLMTPMLEPAARDFLQQLRERLES